MGAFVTLVNPNSVLPLQLLKECHNMLVILGIQSASPGKDKLVVMLASWNKDVL